MSTAFSRSLRALQADTFRRTGWGLAGVLAVLAIGATWLFLGSVEVYETSRTARLEVDRAVYPVAPFVAGRLLKMDLAVGQRVGRGDLLVELEAEAERLRAEEERARLTSAKGRVEALGAETNAAEQAWQQERKTALLGIEEARAHQREADTAAQFAEGEAKRTTQLSEGGLVAKAERLKADADAKQRREAALALGATVQRITSEVENMEKNHQSRVAKLRTELAAMEGELGSAQASLQRLAYDIERRNIRAPVAGRLGEVAATRPGAFVNEGERLAAIIPDGELRAVAHFSPVTSVGRVRPGQRARLRLDGFPWIQYGSLAGIVTSVASEPREGLIRVELTVDPASAPKIPLQHGLPGAAEITIERVSPAALVFRAVGKVLAATPSP